MNKHASIWIAFLFLFCQALSGQDSLARARDTLVFKGQLISWANINPGNDLPVWLGGRYLPQANYSLYLPKTRLFDIEASANLFGNLGLHHSILYKPTGRSSLIASGPAIHPHNSSSGWAFKRSTSGRPLCSAR
jgi:hypothetical protein